MSSQSAVAAWELRIDAAQAGFTDSQKEIVERLRRVVRRTANSKDGDHLEVIEVATKVICDPFGKALSREQKRAAIDVFCWLRDELRRDLAREKNACSLTN